MDPVTAHLEKLLELDARHDDLLERLADLDRRVNETLSQLQAPCGEVEPAAPLSAGGPDALTC